MHPDDFQSERRRELREFFKMLRKSAEDPSYYTMKDVYLLEQATSNLKDLMDNDSFQVDELKSLVEHSCEDIAFILELWKSHPPQVHNPHDPRIVAERVLYWLKLNYTIEEILTCFEESVIRYENLESNMSKALRRISEISERETNDHTYQDLLLSLTHDGHRSDFHILFITQVLFIPRDSFFTICGRIMDFGVKEYEDICSEVLSLASNFNVTPTHVHFNS